MRRITKAALGGLAGGGLVLAGTMAAGASTSYRYVDKLGDFSATEGPFDSTNGKVTIVENDNGTTTFSIKITGIDVSVAQDEFGAHLHTGPCVDGDYDGSPASPIPGGEAGPHYNTQLRSVGGTYDSYGAIPDSLKTANTEVWFDLVPSKEDGAASYAATVEFVPAVANTTMSIVVHALPTNTDPLRGPVGGAGLRQACFPLDVPTHWKYVPPDSTG
jgi:Cu/Zn superoxide dismutase